MSVLWKNTGEKVNGGTALEKWWNWWKLQEKYFTLRTTNEELSFNIKIKPQQCDDRKPICALKIVEKMSKRLSTQKVKRDWILQVNVRQSKKTKKLYCI